MSAELEAVKMQRNLWKDRALHQSNRVIELVEAAKEHHFHCEVMEATALEAVQAAREVARIYDAVLDGTTGIGGAL